MTMRRVAAARFVLRMQERRSMSGHKHLSSENDAACNSSRSRVPTPRAHAGPTSVLNTSSPSWRRLLVPSSIARHTHVALCATSVFLSSKTRLAPRINRANAAKAARAPKRVRGRSRIRRGGRRYSGHHIACLFREIFSTVKIRVIAVPFSGKRVIAITSADACDRPDLTSARQTSTTVFHYRVRHTTKEATMAQGVSSPVRPIHEKHSNDDRRRRRQD